MMKTIVSIHPLEKVLLSFIALIFIGALMLMIPASTRNGISVIDALFTATSAVCVTGLTVLDTPATFTLFGRIVLLLLIQFGGFGIMTFSLGLFSMLGKNLSVKWRYTLEGLYSDAGKIPIKSILKRVIKYTFMIESVTALILFSQFYRDFPLGEAIEHSLFHAISAFCNAGFSTFSNNLIGYQQNVIINLTIAVAIIMGGLGFIVLSELSRFLYGRRLRKKQSSGLSIHTRINLIMTLLLIVLGCAGFLVMEWNNTLKDLGPVHSLTASFFQSVTCRTAGFNTVDIAQLRESTLLMMIGLMFIGGSPGSIAGGIKTTTMFVVLMLVYSKLTGRKNVVIFRRSLDGETVDRSVTLFILSILFISLTVFILLAVEAARGNHNFLSVLFETVSAFGTVGLSMGLTINLKFFEKAILIAVMLAGRLGLLTILMALTLKKKRIAIEYPREHIMIG